MQPRFLSSACAMFRWCAFIGWDDCTLTRPSADCSFKACTAEIYSRDNGPQMGTSPNAEASDAGTGYGKYEILLAFLCIAYSRPVQVMFKLLAAETPRMIVCQGFGPVEDIVAQQGTVLARDLVTLALKHKNHLQLKPGSSNHWPSPNDSRSTQCSAVARQSCLMSAGTPQSSLPATPHDAILVIFPAASKIPLCSITKNVRRP